MGLSAFEETSSPSPYCCPSIDRSLTKRLIECSNNPSKVNSSCFAHTPEWVDGLDIWSSSQISSTKTDVPRRQLDFHRDIGLYLPRHEKPNSAPISTKNLHHHHHHHSTAAITHLPPERLRILIRKEKDLLLQNDPPKPPVLINHPSPSLQTPPPLPVAPTNTTRQGMLTFTLVRFSSFQEFLSVPSVESEVRLPLRHTPNKPLSPPPQPPLPPKLNQDTLKSLLKEHLTSLLTRGASTINTHRSILNTPSLELRQQLRSEPKLTEERLSKLDEFIPTQQMKTNQTSPLIFYQRSTLGLTVTPVDLCSQRNIQSVSLEKMAQQRTNQADSDVSSVNSSRPSTQPSEHCQ